MPNNSMERQFTLHLSDVADDDVRLAIAAPLVRFNESQAGPSGSASSCRWPKARP